MLNFLEVTDACITILGVIYFIRELLKVALILIPICLIVMLSLDFAKGVISFDENNNKKITDHVIRRVIYTIIIFLIPSTIYGVLNVLGLSVQDSYSCWNYVNDTDVDTVKEITEARDQALAAQVEKKQEALDELTKKKMSAIVESQTTRIPTNNGTGSNTISGNGQKVRLTWFSDGSLGAGMKKNTAGISKNSQGWYTYKNSKLTNGQEYIVIATATKQLKRQSGWESYNPPLIFQYYDTMKLEINGKVYNAIVLDSCGACMKYDGIKIDLWSSKSPGTDWANLV